VDDIITFITTNEINRRLSYEKLIDILSLNIPVDKLRRTLASRGYNRRVALGRPDIKEKNLLDASLGHELTLTGLVMIGVE